jgi:hypothetical protein
VLNCEATAMAVRENLRQAERLIKEYSKGISQPEPLRTLYDTLEQHYLVARDTWHTRLVSDGAESRLDREVLEQDAEHEAFMALAFVADYLRRADLALDQFDAAMKKLA